VAVCGQPAAPARHCGREVVGQIAREGRRARHQAWTAHVPATRGLEHFGRLKRATRQRGQRQHSISLSPPLAFMFRMAIRHLRFRLCCEKNRGLGFTTWVAVAQFLFISFDVS
jgi:hypothetical protein